MSSQAAAADSGGAGPVQISIEALLPTLNVSDVFNETAVTIMMRVTDVFSVATILSSLFLIYMVLRATPQSMSGMRPYLLFYVLSGLSDKLVASCFKPVMIMPYGIFFPVGWLSPMAPLTVEILSTSTYVCIFLLLTSLLMMLVDRFFAMTVTNHTMAPFYKKNQFYLLISLSMSSAACLCILYANCFSGQYTHGAETARFLLLKVRGSQILVDRQPNLLSLNFTNSLFAQQLFGNAVSVCGVYFLAMFLLFIVLNIFVARKSHHLMSERLRKNHSMLLRMTYAQILGLLAFVFAPQFFFFYIAPYTDNASISYSIGLIVRDLFFLYDVTVTVMTIRPYRTYIYQLVSKKKPSTVTPSKASGLAVTNKTTHHT